MHALFLCVINKLVKNKIKKIPKVSFGSLCMLNITNVYQEMLFFVLCACVRMHVCVYVCVSVPDISSSQTRTIVHSLTERHFNY